jgi:eukaryotic-like serine/threonine-protein kinase
VTYVTMVVMDRARVRDALAEATASAYKAEQVTDFAVGMFDAGGARGTVDSLSARELLTRGVARAHELAGQPATEAQMLDLIGRIRMEIGDYAEAGPVLREALEIRRRTLGENHADVATSLMNNAALLGAMDRDDTSGVPMLRRALAIRQQLFGAADPRSTDALYQLASGLHMAGQYRVARPQFDEWMRLVATQRPQLTPERAEQLGTLASIMEFSHQLQRADTLRREVLALDRMLYGERHYRVAADLSQIGGLQLDLGDPLAADTLLRQAVALLRANYPDGHPQLAHALRNYGYLLVNEGRWPEADTVWRESAASYRRFAGAQSLGYANSMTFVGLTQVMRGHAVEAEHTLRAVLASNAGQRPSPNPVENRARLFLGKALLEQGRMTEAEPLLLDGFRVASASSASPAGLRLAARSLVTLYTSEGRTAEAAKYRQAASAVALAANR